MPFDVPDWTVALPRQSVGLVGPLKMPNGNTARVTTVPVDGDAVNLLVEWVPSGVPSGSFTVTGHTSRLSYSGPAAIPIPGVGSFYGAVGGGGRWSFEIRPTVDASYDINYQGQVGGFGPTLSVGQVIRIPTTADVIDRPARQLGQLAPGYLGSSALFSAPGGGVLASVVFPASASTAWHLQGADFCEIATAALAGAQFPTLHVLDGATEIWKQYLVVAAAAGSKDSLHLALPLIGTPGNSLTVEFTSGNVANSLQAVSALAVAI